MKKPHSGTVSGSSPHAKASEREAPTLEVPLAELRRHAGEVDAYFNGGGLTDSSPTILTPRSRAQLAAMRRELASKVEAPPATEIEIDWEREGAIPVVVELETESPWNLRITPPRGRSVPSMRSHVPTRGRLAARRSVRVRSALVTFLVVSLGPGCALFAPSDEEAMGGTGPVDAAAEVNRDTPLDASAGADDAASSLPLGGQDADAASESGEAGDARSPSCSACSKACNGETCASCSFNGGACKRDSDCCGSTCILGVCGGTGTCVAEGAGCTSLAECCAALTCTGGLAGLLRACRRCAPTGASCGADTDCCSAHCAAGSCDACIPDGQPTSVASRCCSGASAGGKCTAP